MRNTYKLLSDTHYITELLNSVCSPRSEEKPFVPINPEWVDEVESLKVSYALRGLLPEESPYLTYVLVERNPDTLYDGVCIADNDKRLRYIVVTVVPDAEFPFNYSFPLIHAMTMVELNCWEMVRATLAASRKDMQVLIATEPIPPMLNNARLEWVSIHLGRKPYEGVIQLREQMVDECENENVGKYDVHLFRAREAEPNPLLQELIDAYDADCPET